MATDRRHFQMAITITGSGMKVNFKIMGPINSEMDHIIKDNGFKIIMKDMDNIIPKMIISFQQVIGKIVKNKDSIY
jgi:hypothetical protein